MGTIYLCVCKYLKPKPDIITNVFPLILNISYISTRKNQERVQSGQMYLCTEECKHTQTHFVHLAGVSKAGSKFILPC